jgi:hypothetical protein
MPGICAARGRGLMPCASLEHLGPAARVRVRRARTVAAGLLITLLGSAPACSSGKGQSATADDLSDPDVARYRLPLRYNPVDPGSAFRCYGQCQAETSPNGYLKCLAGCPGFEITQGHRCADDEVPPIAACFTVRQIPKQSEPSPGWVVLAVIANVALIVTLASVCASSASQCGYGYYYPPGPPPY